MGSYRKYGELRDYGVGRTELGLGLPEGDSLGLVSLGDGLGPVPSILTSLPRRADRLLTVT